MRTIIGTELDDLLRGTRHFDLIEGLGGDDTIYGGSTRDTIHGGAGNDRIFTGPGPDLAFGGDGDDFIMDTWTFGGVEVLHGGAGNDTIVTANGGALGPYGERTDWWMFGEGGRDKLVAGEGGTAHMYGGDDRDVLIMSSYGGGEAFGGAGDDVLLSEQRDIIDAWFVFGDKYDPGSRVTLDGGTGNDVMTGYSANSDTFVFNPGDGRDIIRNLDAGTEYGFDRIDLSGFDFEMSAEEVYATYAIDRGDRIVLNFGDAGQLVIYDTVYGDRTDLTPQDVIDALLV